MRVAITILVSCVAALVALGMVMLYSSGSAVVNNRTQLEIGAHYLKLQGMWFAVGLVACIAATTLDYQQLKRFAWPLFILACLLLLMVWVPPWGQRINNANRWIRLWGFTIQPSELGKLALIIVLARYCEHNIRQIAGFKRGILMPGCFMAVIIGLIFFEFDVGNALLLAAVCGVMLLIAGIRFRYFILPVLVVIIGIGAFIYHNPMRSQRVYSWLHVEETKRGKGLQAYQGMVALGSGGLTGRGLGNGRLKHGYIPEHHTDFILPIIGEELGLIATLSIVAAFIAIVLCGIVIAMHARDAFGMLLASGITFLIGLQAFINISVVTGVLPNKGLPLPFISYGGSNLVMMLVCVGLLLSIARRAKIPEVISPNPFADELPEAQTS